MYGSTQNRAATALICICLCFLINASNGNVIKMTQLIQAARTRIVQDHLNLDVSNDFNDNNYQDLKGPPFTIDCNKYPEACLNVSQIIEYRGYPCENHKVQTEDGFILSLQHIPHGKVKDSNTNKPVVFLQHGLLCSATDWVMNAPNESLAFILADAGFDVWLGNSRGNTYSKKHVKYDPSSQEFWAWSFDELAKYDLPANINYILKQSNQQKLHYVGHSQGTTIAFAEFSNNKELASKVETMFALAPVATVGHIKGMLKWLAYVSIPANDFFKVFGIREFLPNSVLMRTLSALFCTFQSSHLCEDILFLVVGFDKQGMDLTRIPVYTAHTPAGTSVQNMMHFSQMVESHKFQMHDFGRKNMLHYNQTTPPLYDVSKMDVPVVAFTAGQDWLADPQDVAPLLKSLRNLRATYNIPEWDHLDFMWGQKANERVYSKIVAMIKGSQ